MSDSIGPFSEDTFSSTDAVIDPTFIKFTSIRVNPDADKKVQVDLKIVLVSGSTHELTTNLVLYTYGDVPSPKHVLHKIELLPYLTSTDGTTMFTMSSVAVVKVLNIKELYENS